MARLLRLFALLLLFPSAPNPALAKSKMPSAYDGHLETYVSDGRQLYPAHLYGVAIDWNKACNKGDAAQCLKLAGAFESGLGDIEADPRAAVGYYMQACKAGSGEGCATAARMLREGTPGYTLPALAQQQAERGCGALKYQPACASLAVSQATGAAKGTGRADGLLAGACSAGDDDGCRIRANTLFYTQGDPASRAEALKLFDPACKARKSWGCLGMVDAYANGWGLARDGAKAADYARIGCEETRGEKLRLCTDHGRNLLATGNAKAIDKGEGILDASCAANDSLACYAIARWAIEPHRGGLTTLKEGYYYARRGCDLEFGQACTLLAAVYEGRYAHESQAEIALPLYERACRFKDQTGCDRAAALIRARPGLRGQIPAIDPSLPVADQLRRAKAAVDRGDRDAAIFTVVRLMDEGSEDADWLLGGWMYYGLSGAFGPERKGDGLILFENAARVGHVDAAIFMGMAYWYGEGVAEDHAKGENYMGIAAMKGSKMAEAILRSMKAEPIRQERARREKEAAEWREKHKNDWTLSWSTYTPTWTPPASTYSPYTSSGPTVAQIYDNHNFNNAMDYYRGYTTACAVSNPYC